MLTQTLEQGGGGCQLSRACLVAGLGRRRVAYLDEHLSAHTTYQEHMSPHTPVYGSQASLQIQTSICLGFRVQGLGFRVGSRRVAISRRAYVSSYYEHMCPHTTMYVSSYYYMCVLIPLLMCPHTTMYYVCLHTTIYYVCVFILLCTTMYYVCLHTTIYYVCVFILLCTICVLILLHYCIWQCVSRRT